ncbi:hypothetical protein PINS_up014466 [Pythium insidiosum]|nr:hypothetical protein PINS_up014466 [Pythium insidiosum]
MEIKMLAQRTAYGARPARANLYEDASAAALWCWEVTNLDMYFDEAAQKTVRRMRRQRKRVGAQIKSLARVVQLLATQQDDAKASQEEAKIGRFVALVEAEEQKAREKERKESQKAQALEEKRRADQERLQAKEDEKRRREQEQEAQRELSAKRRKSLVSYFRSIDTASDAAPADPTASTAVPTVGVAAIARPLDSTNSTSCEQLMARMDRAVDFLVGDMTSADGDEDREERPTVHSMSLLQRTRSLLSGRSGAWSGRRRRDPKLGVMKLLQFHENYRPAFYGTCSRRPRVFRGGRRPFAQFSKLDYTIDSDEEWEEEEPGESLSGAESDQDESDDDQLDYGDDWLAYEDEIEYEEGAGEADELEPVEDEDDLMLPPDDVEDRRKRRREAKQQRRGRRVAAEHKKQKLTKLEPLVVGPFVCADASKCEHLPSYRGQLLATPSFVSPLMRKAEARALEEKERLAKQAEKLLHASSNVPRKDGDDSSKPPKQGRKQKAKSAASPHSSSTPAIHDKKPRATPPKKTPKRQADASAPLMTSPVSSKATSAGPAVSSLGPHALGGSDSDSDLEPVELIKTKKVARHEAPAPMATQSLPVKAKGGIGAWLATPPKPPKTAVEPTESSSDETKTEAIPMEI